MKKTLIFATASAAEEAFYEALEAGEIEPLVQLWAEDEDVVCVHPNGSRATGLAAVRATFEEMLSSGGIDIRVSNVHIQQTATMAVHHLTEHVAVSGDQGGSEIVQLAATNVYLKGPVGWQMILHQVTPLDGEQSTSTEVSTSNRTMGVLH